MEASEGAPGPSRTRRPRGLRAPPVGDASDAPDQAASPACQDRGLRCFVRSCPLQRRAEHVPVPIILGTCTIMGSPAPRTVHAAPASFSGPCNPALTTLFYGDLSHCPGRRDVSRWWSGRQGTRIPPVGCTVVRPSRRMESELPRAVSLTQRRTSARVSRDALRTGAVGISLGAPNVTQGADPPPHPGHLRGMQPRAGARQPHHRHRRGERVAPHIFPLPLNEEPRAVRATGGAFRFPDCRLVR